jgi:hypothetical protein
MPDFCCKMLSERGAIVSSADISATDLEAAIGHASALLHTSNQSASSRSVLLGNVLDGWSVTPELDKARSEKLLRWVLDLDGENANARAYMGFAPSRARSPY